MSYVPEIRIAVLILTPDGDGIDANVVARCFYEAQRDESGRQMCSPGPHVEIIAITDDSRQAIDPALITPEVEADLIERIVRAYHERT